MNTSSTRVRLLACGVFRREFYALAEFLQSSFDPVFIDSRLHLDPERLKLIIGHAITKQQGRPIVLAFGDCCPHMDKLEGTTHVARTVGLNCSQILLGSQRYRELQRERVFLLMPEWALRWECVLKEELGLATAELARDFMTHIMCRAAYIDTGVMPIPKEQLSLFSEYSGLPVTIETVGLERLEEALKKALAALMPHGNEAEASYG